MSDTPRTDKVASGELHEGDGTSESLLDDMTDHAKILERERNKLRVALARLVGVNTEDELAGMESYILADNSVPSEDKIAMTNAVRLLRETL